MPQIDPDKHILAAVTMAANIDTEALEKLIDLEHRTHLCVQLESAIGTRAGALYLQGRLKGATNWSTLDTLTVTAGVLFNEVRDWSNLGIEEFRIYFVDSTSGAGAGTLDARWVSKRGAV